MPEQQILAQQEKVWETLDVNSGNLRTIDWREISDVASKVRAKINHVLRIEGKGRKFTGCHSKIALDDYISKTPGARYELRDKVMDPSRSGVYETTPVIILEDGTEIVRGNNRGRSTFFPDEWDEERILQEVEYAVVNNHGKSLPPSSSKNEYFGFSLDRKIRIHFYLDSSTEQIISYYPILNAEK